MVQEDIDEPPMFTTKLNDVDAFELTRAGRKPKPKSKPKPNVRPYAKIC